MGQIKVILSVYRLVASKSRHEASLWKVCPYHNLFCYCGCQHSKIVSKLWEHILNGITCTKNCHILRMITVVRPNSPVWTGSETWFRALTVDIVQPDLSSARPKPARKIWTHISFIKLSVVKERKSTFYLKWLSNGQKYRCSQNRRKTDT